MKTNIINNLIYIEYELYNEKISYLLAIVVFFCCTFTMPNADVTIEAIFVPKENPETADIAIIAIIITALIGIIAFFQTKKKLNWLK